MEEPKLKRFLWFVFAFVQAACFAAAPPTSPYKINSAADIRPGLNLTFGTITAGQLKIPTNQTFTGGTTAKFFGDSYTDSVVLQNSVALGGDVTQKWPTILCAELSLSCTDTAVGGSQLVESDQMNAILGASVGGDNQLFMQTDFNGRDEIGTDATKLGYWKDAFTVAALNLSIPSGSNKIFNNNNVSISSSGTWADSGNYGGSGHEQSSLDAGAYKEFTGYFSNLYWILSRDVTSDAVYQITLDGVDYADGDCSATWTSGGGTAMHPSSHYPFPVAIHTTSGTHTVRLTVVSGSTGGVYFDKILIPDNAATATGPNLYVGTPARVATYPSSGMVYNHGSDAANGAMTDIIKSVVSDLTSYGLRIVVVPTDQIYNPLTMVGPDNIHPNQAGHTAIAGAFYEAMTGAKQPQVTSTGPFGTDGSGNFALTKGLSITGSSNNFGLSVLTPTLSKGISVLSNKTLGSGSGGGFWAGTSLTPTAGSQRVGGMVYYSNDGTNLYTPLTIYGYSDSEGWNGSHQGSMLIINATTPGTTGLHEVMRIRGNGNVGIGNTSVPNRLSISDGGVRIDTLAVPTAGSFAAALAGAGAGNVDNGAHNYRVTYVNPAGETTYSTGVTATVTDKTTNGQVSLTAIPVSTSSTVTARNIYRTAVGSSTYQFLATISDNTTTTYTDNIADSSLTTTAPLTNTAGGNLITSTGTPIQLAGLNVGIKTSGAYDLSLGSLTVGSTSTGTGVFVTNTTAAGASSGGGLSLGMNSLAAASGNRFGVLSFHGWTGTAYVQPVSIKAFANQTWTSGSAYGSYLTINTTAASSTTQVQRVKIDESGLQATSLADTRQSVTPSGSTAIDFALGGTVQMTLGASNSIASLSHIIDGGIYRFVLLQDGTGSRTLTWGSSFKFVGGAAPTLTTTATTGRDTVTFISNGTTLYEVGRALDVR